MYLSTALEPQRPCSWMRQTSMPLDAKKIAPVTRHECPENLWAPYAVTSCCPSMAATMRMTLTTACLDGALPSAVGNAGKLATSHPNRCASTVAQATCTCRVWYGQSAGDSDAQVHPSDLLAPKACGSDLDEGKHKVTAVMQKRRS